MRVPICINDYTEWLNDRKRFVQANYGDGEWSCILNRAGSNCNGEDYTHPLCEALQDTLLHPPPGNVWFGSNPGKLLHDAVETWIAANQLEQRVWIYKEIISGANVNGKLRPFIGAVRGRRTILVGPEHLNCESVHKVWNIRRQVLVPAANAFTSLPNTIAITATTIEDTNADLVLVCSGMAANPLMFTLARMHPDATMIDMGATLDPYAGVWSRKGYRKPEFQQAAMHKNTEGLA